MRGGDWEVNKIVFADSTRIIPTIIHDIRATPRGNPRCDA